MIVVTILIILASIFVLHILAQSPSGLPSIFFYFVQMAMLMLPSSESWLSWIDLFSGSASTAAFGICIAPLSAGQQMIISVCSILIFWTALLIILLVQMTLLHTSWCRCHATIKRLSYPSQRYWRSAIELYLFSYTTIANTLIGYMSCVDINNGSERVIFTEPTISCNTSVYNGWLVVVVLLFITVIIMPPVWFIIHLTRNRSQFSNRSFAAHFGSLYEPFTPISYWYVCFVI
jgi:hypothetical protein